jgi:hypothetical protein
MELRAAAGRYRDLMRAWSDLYPANSFSLTGLLVLGLIAFSYLQAISITLSNHLSSGPDSGPQFPFYR